MESGAEERACPPVCVWVSVNASSGCEGFKCCDNAIMSRCLCFVFLRLWAFSSIYYTLRSATQWTLSQRGTMPCQTEQKLIFNVQKNSLKTVERIKASYSVSFQLFSFWLFACRFLKRQFLIESDNVCFLSSDRTHTHTHTQAPQTHKRVSLIAGCSASVFRSDLIIDVHKRHTLCLFYWNTNTEMHIRAVVNVDPPVFNKALSRTTALRWGGGIGISMYYFSDRTATRSVPCSPNHQNCHAAPH